MTTKLLPCMVIYHKFSVFPSHLCNFFRLVYLYLDLVSTESCFRHPLFDLRGPRKVEIRHTHFHFSSKKVTSKSRKVEVFDLTIVKKLSTFRPKKAKVEKLKSRKVEKLKSGS